MAGAEVQLSRLREEKGLEAVRVLVMSKKFGRKKNEFQSK